jgi:ferritin-like metal-binding protein YciE
MTMQSLEELFIDKLKDVYDSERRITRALPKMIKHASSAELVMAFEEHLQQTQGQIRRLDQIFKRIGTTPGRKTCHGMMGILEEGEELMEKKIPKPVMDAALIGGAQEVEHYEIAGYGCLKTWAELLGKHDEAKLLQETLEEEEDTDRKLTQLATSINAHAEEVDETEAEDAAMTRRPARRATPSSGARSRRKKSAA